MHARSVRLALIALARAEPPLAEKDGDEQRGDAEEFAESAAIDRAQGQLLEKASIRNAEPIARPLGGGRYPLLTRSRKTMELIQTCPEDRPVAVQELIWALLTSAEFRFNH